MKHKHYDMIVAKAANMDLVIFVKNEQNDGNWWALTSDKEILPSFSNGEYFACLLKHKEACLHWLNGGDVLVKDFDDQSIERLIEASGFSGWHDATVFTAEDAEIRIKPRKEKRWIGYCVNRNQTFPHPQESKELAVNYAEMHYSYKSDEWQFIEIEVEV